VVNVILWFDAEDFVLLADDDATKRLAEMLTARGIRGTFKFVGEKARVLERRHRQDVIATLRKQDIGYHTDFHSVHPTVAEYLAEAGFLDGVAEFIRREGPGAADVRRIFGVPSLSCYGQPGSSWASQAVAALGAVGVAAQGVPCYVDEGDHVGLDNKPFWYAGALVVYDMGPNCTRMDLHDPAALEPAKRKASAIVARLQSQDHGGLVSIYYHPCEWVHREFWDGILMARGANPPRELWKAPPQRPAQETEAAFERFGQYIDHIRALPGVKFVTASDLPALYPDRLRSAGADTNDLAAIAERIVADANNGLNFQTIGQTAYSLADQFELLTRAVAGLLDGKALPSRLPGKGLLGPDAEPPANLLTENLSWPAFRDTVRDVHDFILKQGRVPARVYLGSDPVPPADFLVALASAFHHYARQGGLPEQQGVRLGKSVLVLPVKRVAQDTPGLFGGWVIHKKDFRAPKILQVARWQTWTLKPALPAN
jgi:hypothetical protein